MTVRAHLACLLLALVALVGCVPVSRGRTLPGSIRAIHVPMALNRSAEPGLEERVTVAVQREFLADGRLSMRPEKQADAIIRIQLDEFDRPAAAFDPDDFPTTQAYSLQASITIEENIAGRPAIGGRRKLRVYMPFEADPRRSTFDPEPRTKEALYEEFARQAVLEVLTGEFEQGSTNTGEFQDEPGRAPALRPRS